MANNRCKIIESLVHEEINHEIPHYSDYDHLTDLEKDNLTLEQESKYIMADGYKWMNDMRIRKGNHLLTCDNRQCQELKATWLGESELSRFIKGGDN